MRMKLNKSSQLVLVSAASLLVATLITGCAIVRQATQSLTVDFVYVATAKASGPNDYGEIDAFEVNSESGFMRQIPASPFPSEGRDPVAEAVSPDYSALFVVNQDDNSVVEFVIGIDGKLYPYDTINTPGVFPLAIATTAKEMFVLDTYQPLPSCNVDAPCSGALSVFPLTPFSTTTAITIGQPVVNPAIDTNYWPLTLSGARASDVVVPTGVAVLNSGADVYVTAYDSSVSPAVGYIFGYSVGQGGVLTPLPGSPYPAGSQPSAIAAAPSGNFVYATDAADANILGYSVAPDGVLTPLSGSPYPAGNQPVSIAINPSFPYLFVANSTDATIKEYSIASDGDLTQLGTYATGVDPVAIGIDPSTNRYLYTANFLTNDVSGFALNTTTGAVLNSQFSPFPSNREPTAVAAIPHNGTGAGVSK